MIMRKMSLLAALIISGAAIYAQNNFNQYSLEAGYGLNHSRNPTITGFNHFDVGFRYMQNEYWGAKIDYGHDAFKSDDGLNTTTTLHRVSLQAVYNVGRGLRVNNIARRLFNLMLHGGAGITAIDARGGRPDRAVNLIIGGTGQLYISPDVALMGDLSGILNFSQDHNHNGVLLPDSFTGKVLTFSVGITYYIGRNKSNADWR
jgi:hypothetical protein